MAFLSKYTYTIPGTIDAGFVTVFKAADFPAEMLDGRASGFTNDFGNAIAYESDGGARLPIDVVSGVVGLTPIVEVHVRHGTGGTGATIHWEADDTQTAQPLASALYGSEEVWQDYIAVYHGNDLLDSTANAHHLTAFGTDSGSIVNNASTLSSGAFSFVSSKSNHLTVTGLTPISQPVTISSLFKPVNDTGGGQGIAALIDNTNAEWLRLTYQDNAAGNPLRVQATDSTSASNFADTAGLSIGAWNHTAGTISSVGAASVFLNGGSKVTDSSSTVSATLDEISLGAWRSSTASYIQFANADTDEVRILIGVASDSRISAESANLTAIIAWGTVGPWTEAAGGGVTVDVPAGSITLTGYAPAIQTAFSVTIPSGSITLTGYAPTVLVGAGVDVTVPKGSIALTGYAPTIGIGASVETGLGSISLTGYIPDIVTGGGLTVTPGTGAITLTGYTPVVDVGQSVSVEIPLGSISLTGYAPIVSGGGAVTVETQTGSITLTGYTPTFFGGVVLLTPSYRTLTIAAESRTELTSAESRLSTIPAESRVITIEV